MERGIKLKDNGHYEMPLPFKNDRPNLPDNMVCAIHRLRCLERKLKRNKQYYKDYKTFMDETITRGDAERVPEEDINKAPAWYIPHHGVYHPPKAWEDTCCLRLLRKVSRDIPKRPSSDGPRADEHLGGSAVSFPERSRGNHV